MRLGMIMLFKCCFILGKNTRKAPIRPTSSYNINKFTMKNVIPSVNDESLNSITLDDIIHSYSN